MDLFILVDGEFRSLIRNSLEKIISYKLPQQKTKEKEILFQIATRCIASLIVIQLYNVIKKNEDIKKYASYILIFAFFYLLMNNQSSE